MIDIWRSPLLLCFMKKQAMILKSLHKKVDCSVLYLSEFRPNTCKGRVLVSGLLKISCSLLILICIGKINCSLKTSVTYMLYNFGLYLGAVLGSAL